MEIDIKIVENDDEFQTCISIRRQVFILGLNISADIEMDDDHIDATHVLATMADEPVGTARWRNIDFGVKLERFAVLEDYRNFFADTGIEAETHGVAREYFENADQQLGILPPERHIELNNFITMVKNRSS